MNNQENTQSASDGCCSGDSAFDCSAMMEQFRGKDGSFDCSKMMETMQENCCQASEEKEAS